MDLLKDVLRLCFLLLIVQTTIPESSAAIYDWFFGSSKQSSEEDEDISKNNQFGSSSSSLLARVPFELEAFDEKFLAEAVAFTDTRLSQLDTCHHKIIIGLKKSCNYLSEEEIAKLSVNLLNCQSAVEGRTIYPCTTKMTLKDCTMNMDQDTWNAYHIVSNRARAVCYSTRQVQFRAKTEMTINKLVSTSEEQLLAMSNLQGQQEKLEKITDDTLKTMTVGHETLLQQQDFLKNAHHNLQHHLASNLRELTREKALIAAGQKELAEMTDIIKKKLDVTEIQLSDHEEGRRRSHLEVISDLAEMQARAKLVWEIIDNSTQKILKQHEDTALHYQESLRNLQSLNNSVNYLLNLVERTRIEIDDKLNWLADISGGTGIRMTVLMTIVLHSGYFILFAVASAFVNAPPLTRIALIVGVPLNAFCEINNGQRLDFQFLTVAIVASAILHYIMKITCQVTCSRINACQENTHTLPTNNHHALFESSRRSVYFQIKRHAHEMQEDGSNVSVKECNMDTTSPSRPSKIVSAVLNSVHKIASSMKLDKVRPIHNVDDAAHCDSELDSESSCEKNEAPLASRHFSPNAATVLDARRHLLHTLERCSPQLSTEVRRSPRRKMQN